MWSVPGHHGSQWTPSVLLLPPCPLRCPRHWTLSLSSVRTWEADVTYILKQGNVSIGPAFAARKHGFPDKNLDNHIITPHRTGTRCCPRHVPSHVLSAADGKAGRDCRVWGAPAIIPQHGRRPEEEEGNQRSSWWVRAQRGPAGAR